ncbi:acyltransferase family protein [Fibrella aquatica]|uniref:acyltransferase family protein n=1 Tax=Fibrella aquatica TaxID=3242487 RepID=UPI0035218A25
MGLLRLLLATMVVFVHAGPLPGFPTMSGSLAVQTFYMISGFYMALILNEKYVEQSSAYRLFLTNRLLRLLPLYYVVFSLTLLTAIAMALTIGPPELEFFRAIRDNYDRLSVSTILFLGFANFTLVGQDWLSFLSIDPTTGTLVPVSDFSHSATNLNSLLVVQPAWTISLEITFYVVAPFIVRRKSWVLVLIILMSATIRFVLRQYAHLDSMAWSYRFFPSELMYFVAGSLAYKAYHILKFSKLPNWLCPLALAIALTYTCLFGLVHQALVDLGLPGGVSSALYRLMVVLTLPFVFLQTKHNRLDAKIGDLSYPLYIVHFLVWESLSAWQIGGAYVNIYTLIISVGVAFALNRLIGERVERVRQQYFERNTATIPSMA